MELTTRQAVMMMSKQDFIKVYGNIIQQIKDDEDAAIRRIWKCEEIMRASALEGDLDTNRKACNKKQKLYKEIEDCENAIKEWKPIIEFFFGLDV